jgi:hypothetical protein
VDGLRAYHSLLEVGPKIGDTFAGIKAKRCSLSTVIFLKNRATISKWIYTGSARAEMRKEERRGEERRGLM